MKKLFAMAALAALPVGAAPARFDHSHAAWAALLDKHVVKIDGGQASQVRHDAKR